MAGNCPVDSSCGLVWFPLQPPLSANQYLDRKQIILVAINYCLSACCCFLHCFPGLTFHTHQHVQGASKCRNNNNESSSSNFVMLWMYCLLIGGQTGRPFRSIACVRLQRSHSSLMVYTCLFVKHLLQRDFYILNNKIWIKFLCFVQLCCL